jgi:integrase
MDHFRQPDRHMIVPRLKGGPTNDYLLTDREMKALSAWIRERGSASGPLFPSRNRRPISRKTLHTMMQTYGMKAGLPEAKRHFHCLRHTAGTMLIEKISLEEVQDHLGHRDSRSTGVYAKIRPKRRKALGEQLRSAW